MTWYIADGLVLLYAELGITFGASKNVNTDLRNATTNNCSGSVDQSGDIRITNWDGYNHAAGPGVPTGFSINPGNDSNPTGDLTQDSHVYLRWTLPICASDANVLQSDTSGGTYVEIDADNADDFLVVNLTTQQTSKWFKVEPESNVGTAGTRTAAVEGRTCPTAPLSFSASSDDVCGGVTLTVTWTNGTSPGTRDSIVTWRWKKNAGAWSAYADTATGATSFTHSGGSVVDGDVFYFEGYYKEESSGTAVAANVTVLCFD